jgi:hypothetical protein
MGDQQDSPVKSKIGEVKERLSQLYTQPSLDSLKSKAFESEFSLYLKACEHARNERTEGIRLQHDAVRWGVALLAVTLTFTVYVSILQPILGMLALFGSGLVACGFMYLLCAADLRSAAAVDYCRELETYFREQRWHTGLNETISLAGIPLWEGFQKRTPDASCAVRNLLYAPLRLTMTIANLTALAYLIFLAVVRDWRPAWWILAVSFGIWLTACLLHALLVRMIIEKGRARAYEEPAIPAGAKPGQGSFVAGRARELLTLFLSLDLFLPEKQAEKP